MAEIIERIDAYMVKNGLTATELSRRATGTTDTIRNWQRAVKEDPATASASVLKLNQVEAVIGIELARNGEDAKVRGEPAIAALLQRIEGLTAEDISFLMKNIRSALAENADARPQSHLRDQSEPASRRHAKAPSE